MIRKATLGDWPSISDISSRSGYEDYINRLGSSYLDEGEVLVYEDGSIMGFAKIEFLEDNSVWFSGLRVDPDHWRSGIGRKLTEASLKLATERKATIARLLVYDDNEKSLSLVEKMGFQKIEKYAFLNGMPDTGSMESTSTHPGKGLINIGWKFIDASKCARSTAILYYREKLKILGAGGRTFEILSSGDSKIALSGDGYTCAKEAVDLAGCISNYNDLEASSGYVFEKVLSGDS